MGIDENVWDVNGIKDEYTGNGRCSESRFFDSNDRKRCFHLLLRIAVLANSLSDAAIPNCQHDTPESSFGEIHFCPRLDVVLAAQFNRN